MRTDFLLTLAEISVALAGFAGLIVAISRRRGGSADETRLNLQLLKNVLGASFLAAAFSLLPVALLSMEVDSEAAWRGSAGLLAVALPLYMFRTIFPALTAYRAIGRSAPLSYRANIAIGFVVAGGCGLCAVGSIPSSVYVPAVLFLVYGAAMSFVRVFVSVARDAAV
jgi:hypothetical protein